MPAAEDDLAILGRISGVFGVKGWLKVWSFCEPVEGILDYPVWYLRMPQGWTKYELQEGQRQGKGVIAHLKGCDDRDATRAFLQADVAVPREQLPRLAPQEYYWRDLEGLRVYALPAEGERKLLGVVDHLLETGANDVLVVEPVEGSIDGRQRLIPWVPGKVVVRVNLELAELEVDWAPDF